MYPLKVIKCITFISLTLLTISYASDDLHINTKSTTPSVRYRPISKEEDFLHNAINIRQSGEDGIVDCKGLPCKKEVSLLGPESWRPIILDEYDVIIEKIRAVIGDLGRFEQVLRENKWGLSQIHRSQLDNVLLGQIDQDHFRVFVKVFGKEDVRIYPVVLRSNFDTFISMFEEIKSILSFPDAATRHVRDYLFLYETILRNLSSFQEDNNKSIIVNFILTQLDKEATLYSSKRFSYEGRGVGSVLHKSFVPILLELTTACRSQDQWNKIKNLFKLLTKRTAINLFKKGNLLEVLCNNEIDNQRLSHLMLNDVILTMKKLEFNLKKSIFLRLNSAKAAQKKDHITW